MRYVSGFLMPDLEDQEKFNAECDRGKSAIKVVVSDMLLKSIPVREEMMDDLKTRRFTLDIEAFNQDDWQNFKFHLHNFLAEEGVSPFQLQMIKKFITELEEKGRPDKPNDDEKKSGIIITP